MKFVNRFLIRFYKNKSRRYIDKSKNLVLKRQIVELSYKEKMHAALDRKDWITSADEYKRWTVYAEKMSRAEQRYLDLSAYYAKKMHEQIAYYIVHF